MELSRIPLTLWIYLDEHVPVTAELEVLTAEIRKAIHGHSRLDNLYFDQLDKRHSIEEKLAFARHFWRNLETYRRMIGD